MAECRQKCRLAFQLSLIPWAWYQCAVHNLNNCPVRLVLKTQLFLPLPQPGYGWGEELDFYLFPCSERVLESTTYHEEGISDPQTPPSNRAVRNRDVLTMDCYGDSWGLAHRAAADVGLDFVLSHRHHGQWGGGGEPVGLVIPAGVVADVTRVAVQEGHGAEPSQAGPCQACRRGSQLSVVGKMLFQAWPGSGGPTSGVCLSSHLEGLSLALGDQANSHFLGNRLHWHFSPALLEFLIHTSGPSGSAGSGVCEIASWMRPILGVGGWGLKAPASRNPWWHPR